MGMYGKGIPEDRKLDNKGGHEKKAEPWIQTLKPEVQKEASPIMGNPSHPVRGCKGGGLLSSSGWFERDACLIVFPSSVSIRPDQR